ncbi:hypothetical protein VTO42DRAFT_3638 [Malbranchea cinnamomea]
MLTAALFASTFLTVHAAFVPFRNCLPKSITASDPLQLQFVPLLVSATIDNSNEVKKLDITVYGNVSGTANGQGDYPPPDDPRWQDENETLGKITDVNADGSVYTTLFANLNALTFTPYIEPPTRFCESLTQGTCPLGPVFDANWSDPSQLRAFSVSHDLYSSYSFTSLTSNIRVRSGEHEDIACIAADITPDLGSTLRNVLRFVPLAILVLVGIATVAAAIYSPWGSTDLFRWTSNYGRDEDLLRLVTPGFGDCLQYIQFIVLSGSLSLNYPGFYQPIVSQGSWSTLMFNESLVSHGNGTQAVRDGVYSLNATRGAYGLESMSKFVGLTAPEDLWAGMVVWLLCIIAAVVAVIQLGFALRWLYHTIANIPEEDLQSKNLPFTVGNIVRLVFNYFLLPIVSFSMFQLVIARSSPVYTVALAVVLLVFLICFTAWLLILIARTRPRSFLFDDIPTVLLYGPLYNTYSDGAAPFATITVFLAFMRGIAIGAVQPSGIAQIILLAICEVILILTILAFRPFHYATSMNSYHICFAIIRCIAILLSVAFVPSLDVSDGVRGWVGYSILVLHAIVLLVGFFLNALQTLIEVLARLAGAGGEGGAEGGAARGGLVKVFGLRQLSRRTSRVRHVGRHSINSEAAMLGAEMERPSTQLDGPRPRSFSGSSAALLNQSVRAESRLSTGFDAASVYGVGNSRTGGSGRYTPTTPGAFSAAGHGIGGGISPVGGAMGIRLAETADPYYRPPRQRRATLGEAGGRRQGSMSGGNWVARRSYTAADAEDDSNFLDGGSPTPAYLKAPREDPDDLDGPSHPRTDYAVREVDFYYRVRGPALSNNSNRKLKTGPADPTSPVSSATGWLKGLFKGKTKDKAKGFEVVRSARAPPPGLMPPAERDSFPEPYRDDPEDLNPAAGPTAQDQRSPEDQVTAEQANSPAPLSSNARPPSLPPVMSSESIELPSRVDSQSQRQELSGLRIRPPTIPRKSSKRNSSTDAKELRLENLKRLSTSQVPEEYEQGDAQTPTNKQNNRFPFDSKSASTRSAPVSTHSADSGAPNDDDSSTPRADPLNERASSPVGEAEINRPSSVGYVRQHRASDHIYEVSPHIPPLSETTAEIVKES